MGEKGRECESKRVVEKVIESKINGMTQMKKALKRETEKEKIQTGRNIQRDGE